MLKLMHVSVFLEEERDADVSLFDITTLTRPVVSTRQNCLLSTCIEIKCA
jgi:hypothetical protein